MESSVLLNSIDRLVAESKTATLVERRERQVDTPERALQTIAERYARVVEGSKSVSEALLVNENFAKYLRILANYPILKTELLETSTQEAKIKVGSIEVSARLPIFGTIPYYDRGHITEPHAKVVLGDYHNYRDNNAFCITKDLWGISGNKFQTPVIKKMHLEAICSIAIQLYPHHTSGSKEVAIFLDLPEIPKHIHAEAEAAKQLGFKDLHIIWGPATYTSEVKPFQMDPLLVGQFQNVWFILKQWNLTPEEQQLVPTAAD